MKITNADYGIIRDAINQVYPINSPEGVFVSNHLRKLPKNWITGLSIFVRQFNGAHPGWIAAQLLHDVGGYTHKEIGFSPRCFKGGDVWDIDKKQTKV